MIFFTTFLMIPTILAALGLIGGIIFLKLYSKRKKKAFMVFGILSFVITLICVLYIAGFILLYVIGGSLFGQGSIAPEYR